MHHFFYINKDNTLSNTSVYKNTGGDSIIELTKLKKIHGVSPTTRILLDFNLSDMIQFIDDNNIVSPTYTLKLYVAQANELVNNITIDLLPISSSWVEGYGKNSDYPITEVGSSWISTQGKETESDWDNPGGDFITNLSESFYLQQYENDISLNVTNLISNLSTESYGIGIKYSDSIETNNNHFGSIKWFSSNTHTIYAPKIMISWDASEFNPNPSMSVLNISDFVLYSANLKSIYHINENVKIRINARSMYSNVSFDGSAPMYNTYYLPSGSTYSLVDAYTNDNIIDFNDIYNKISTDSTGSYIDLNFSYLMPNRFYKIIFKVPINGDIVMFNKNFEFKVLK